MNTEPGADLRTWTREFIETLAVAIFSVLLGIAIMWRYGPRDGPCAQPWCELKDLCDIPVGCTKALYVVGQPQTITKPCDWSSLDTLVVLGSSNVKFEAAGHRLPKRRFMMTGVDFDNVIGYKDLFLVTDTLTTFYLTDHDFYTDIHNPADNQKPLFELDKSDGSRTFQVTPGQTSPAKDSGIIRGRRLVFSDADEGRATETDVDFPYAESVYLRRGSPQEPKSVFFENVGWELMDDDSTTELHSQTPQESQ